MDVSFTDPEHGYVLVWHDLYEGAVVAMATSDGGQTWVRRKPGDLGNAIHNFNWLGVSFVDPMRGYAVGDGGRIVATSDGGQSWQLQHSGAEELVDVSFWDASGGVAVGGVQLDDGTIKGLVFATDDGGSTWTSRGVTFADRDNADAVGCVTKTGDLRDRGCIEGAAVRISFSPPAAISDPSSSFLPWLLYGAVFVMLGGAAVFVLRRH